MIYAHTFFLKKKVYIHIEKNKKYSIKVKKKKKRFLSR